MQRHVSTRMRGVSALVAVFLVAGCATVPPPKPETRASIFYPPLPNPPRIQYLTSFSSDQDLQPEHPRRSAFTEFIAGKAETNTQVAVEKPYGIALFAGKLYVADTRGPGYVVFDLKRQKAKFVPGSGAGKMRKPTNLSIDQDGIKYITDTLRNQVLVFDQQDNFLRAYGVENQFKPGDVVIVGNRLYISDLQHHVIQVLDKQTGELLFKFGDTGLKENRLFWPTNMAVSPDGHLYITDTGNFHILKFTLDGEFVDSYGIVGAAAGQFARPKGVALDRKGHIYVVDAAFENVQLFDAAWQLLLFFGEPGSNPENINLPTTVIVDYDNAPLFQKYADPKFKLEYLIIVASQFGRSKVNVFGFGKMEGMDYAGTN